MTPADELAKAATRLDDLIAEASPDWRLDNDNHLALWVIEMPAMIGATETSRTFVVSGPNDATTLYMGTMNPLVGQALVRALRRDAKKIADGTLVQPFYKGNDDLLALARLINGSTS